MKTKMIIPIVAIFVLVSCVDEPKAKIYSCQEYSLSCEMQKDRILVQPITYDTNAIDAMGFRMAEHPKDQWYMISTKAKVLVPVTIFICLEYMKDAGCVKSTNTPTQKQLLNELTDKKIHVTTTNLSYLIPGLTKAAVVVTGPNEVIFNNLPSPYLAEAEKKK